MKTAHGSLAALVLVAPVVAFAEEPPAPAKKSAAERSAALRAAFPAPDAKDGFTAELELFIQGMPAGKVVASAKPATADGRTTWLTEQRVSIDFRGTKQNHVSSAVLAQDLRIVTADYSFQVGENPADETHVTPVDRGIAWTPKGEGKTATTVEGDASATAAPVGPYLFFRRLPVGPDAHEIPVWDPQKKAISLATVEVKGPATLDAFDVKMPAHLVLSTRGGEPTECFLDPKDRSLLALHNVKRGTWMIRSDLPRNAAEPVPDLAKPPTSAKGAGMLFAMGILVGDIEAVSRCIHWPSFHEAAQKEQGFPGDADALKDLVLGMITPSLQALKPDDAWRAVRTAAKEAKEESTDAGVRVALPPPHQPYVAKEIEGRWWIVSMEPPGAR
jgi:hypothetical protein